MSVPFRDEKPLEFYFPGFKSSDLTDENHYSMENTAVLDTGLDAYHYCFFSHEFISEVRPIGIVASIGAIEAGWDYGENLSLTSDDTSVASSGYIVFSRKKIPVEYVRRLECRLIGKKTDNEMYDDEFSIENNVVFIPLCHNL